MVLKTSTSEEVVDGISNFFDLPRNNSAVLMAALKEMEKIREKSIKDQELHIKDQELHEMKNEIKQMKIK